MLNVHSGKNTTIEALVVVVLFLDMGFGVPSLEFGIPRLSQDDLHSCRIDNTWMHSPARAQEVQVPDLHNLKPSYGVPSSSAQ